MSRRAPTGAAVLQPQVTRAITEAALQEWAEKGYARLSMEAVARRAGVGKSALYRRWPCKQDMVLTVFDNLRDSVVTIPDTGSFYGDIYALMRAIRNWFNHPHISPIVADMVAETVRDSSLNEVVEEVLRARHRAQAAPIFERAIARGELEPGIDPEMVLELFASIIYWRSIVRAKPVTDDYLHIVITTIQCGLAASASH